MSVSENEIKKVADLADLNLTQAEIKQYAIDMNDNEAVFYVAHAIDLKNEECWSLYMHYVYENEIVQPFKQVFREVYPITQEELNEKNISRRYAGFQIQANKAVAVLRSRGWIASYEQGLEKVNYIQDVYVTLYADMDFFTPADVESPTLEYVSFYSRKTDKAIDLKDIDEVLFSETMRDLDLMVSTSYVGGVDPESSHSTVEMRIAIAKELTGMLSLSNVSFLDRHSKIEGKLGEYSVHIILSILIWLTDVC